MIFVIRVMYPKNEYLHAHLLSLHAMLCYAASLHQGAVTASIDDK